MHDRIEIPPIICHGQPRVADTRVMVYPMLDLLAAGKTVPEITGEDEFPDLTDEDVLARIACAGQMIRDQSSGCCVDDCTQPRDGLQS